MYECPIDYFKDNLLYGRDKTCWAVYEFVGFDYDMISDEEKKRIHNRFTLFLANITHEAKIMVIPVIQDLDEQFAMLEKGLQKNDPLYHEAKRQLKATKDYLQKQVNENGKTNDYKTFIAIKLMREGENETFALLKEKLELHLNALRYDIMAILKADSKDIPAERIRNCEKLSKIIYQEQRKRMNIFPVSEETMQWLLRRTMYRGMKKDMQLYRRAQNKPWRPYSRKIELARKKYIRPRQKDIVKLFSGAISRKHKMLEIAHEGECSYQTFLAVTLIPDNLIFPDCEWIYNLQQYNRQAEMYIHINTVAYRDAIKKIGKQRDKANSQLQNIADADAHAPENLFESKDDIEGLEMVIREGKMPLIDTSITICLSSDDPEELEEKAKYIRDEYEDMQFIVERPLTDQLELFMQCIPAVGVCVPDYNTKLPPDALASGIVGVTHELGDIVAPFVGTSGAERKRVAVDLRQACLLDISANTVFYGALGVGKSFNANLMLYLHVLYYGAYGLVIDPKNERTHWVEKLKPLKGMIKLVTLSSDPKYRGTLDPFNIYPNNMADAGELTMNLLCELFRIRPHPEDNIHTALQTGVKLVKKSKNPCIMELANILETFDGLEEPDEREELKLAGKKLARKIRLLEDSGMAQLFIGDGTEQALTLDDRLNILQIENLKLPDVTTKKDDYTEPERISMAIMMAITSFTIKFIHSRPGKFKVVLFDESWMLGKTAEGEKLMSYGSRTSRSLYSSIILNGHSVTDLPNEGIRNSITYKFCFKTPDREEAERMLDFMKMEKTKSNLELMMTLGDPDNPDEKEKRRPECLFQDRNGRVGILTFDAVFDDLIDVFGTTPVDASEQEQIAYSAGLEGTSEPPEDTLDISAYSNMDSVVMLENLRQQVPDIFEYEAVK